MHSHHGWQRTQGESMRHLTYGSLGGRVGRPDGAPLLPVSALPRRLRWLYVSSLLPPSSLPRSMTRLYGKLLPPLRVRVGLSLPLPLLFVSRRVRWLYAPLVETLRALSRWW